MRFVNFFDSSSNFRSEPDIRNYLKTSKNFEADLESPDNSETLLIFQTSKQQTWLVATARRLYCILDDIREKKPHINWSIQKTELVDGTNVILDINTHETRKKHKTIGCVDVGPNHKNWLYTKLLFEKQDITSSIKALIARNMLGK